MKIPQQVLWVLALFFLQQLPAVAEWGIDLPLLFVVLVGLRSPVAEGAGWGFLLGLMQDLLSAGWIGPNVIAKTLTGILASMAKKHIYREKVFTQTFLILVSAFFHQTVVWLVKLWDGSAPNSGDVLWLSLRMVFSTALVGMVVSFFVVKFRRRRFDPATA